MKEAATAGEAQSARLLAGLARRIASSLDLQETLQIVVSRSSTSSASAPRW